MIQIRAGRVEEVTHSSGEWLFIDVGFSSVKKTCGVLSGDGDPKLLKFSEVKDCLLARARVVDRPLNLVLEAPLSVAWRGGDPIGRAVERREGKSPRYWYAGLGCGVLIATTYLLRALSEAKFEREVRLFEGFVSFKEQHVRSDHKKDVMALRSVAWDATPDRPIFAHERLKLEPDDELCSAFAVSGMDFGVPPVIVANPADSPSPNVYRGSGQSS